MKGHKIPNGFIDFGTDDFFCPNCKKKYSDDNDKYLNRIKRNKSWITKIKCDCEATFNLTFDYTGDLVTFLNSNNYYD